MTRNIFKSVLISLFCVSVSFSASAADLTLSHLDPAWKDGKGDVPEKGLCKRDGGGMSPPIKVSGIPSETVKLLINFTDEDYGDEGGHGGFEFKIFGESEVTIPSIEGGVDKMPPNMKGVIEHHGGDRNNGTYYLGPCSGGRGNTYTVYIYAKDKADEELAKGKLSLGIY
jgi:phosphatidylethanolamine-binding protein (PEBP) family uncharacterized protein